MEVPIHYDPMISKLAAWGATTVRESISRLQRALDEYIVGGIRTTIPFFKRVLTDPDFIAGRIDTGYIARMLADQPPSISREEIERDLDNEELVAAIIAALEHLQASSQVRPQAGDSTSKQSQWRLAARQAILGKRPMTRLEMGDRWPRGRDIARDHPGYADTRRDHGPDQRRRSEQRRSRQPTRTWPVSRPAVATPFSAPIETRSSMVSLGQEAGRSSSMGAGSRLPCAIHAVAVARTRRPAVWSN
jgi:acetyl/propionyl-CoA carboxylase alpha subunit